MCWAGIELAGLQGEASGKFLCSGRWHEERLSSAARGAPMARSFLAEQHKPSSHCSGAVPMVGCHGVLPATQPCCRNSPSLLQTSPCGTASSAAAHHPPSSSHPMAQGFVLGVSVTSRCPHCILGFPLQISSSPLETGGDLGGLHEVVAHERETTSGRGGRGCPQTGLTPSPSISPPAGGCPEDAAGPAQTPGTHSARWAAPLCLSFPTAPPSQ